MTTNKIKIAVNGGIGFGAKLTPKQLLTIAKYMDEADELELTTFQQLYLEVPENNLDAIKEEFTKVDLHCYPVGNYVKSLRTCNFCKGELEEGMPVAKELNTRIAGKPVPFTLKPAYTGCPIGCGEPMVNDIGVMKIRDSFNVYVGGKAKGKEARVGELLYESLTPEQLYSVVDQIIDIYGENGKKREDFPRFINRFGVESLKEQISF
ncbi:nitrite/sulfite reductase ferredoxin-like protein [Bacillus oleivorans]|uniref:Nitrite/sulfite reductase ferredoxin-like protein n=1 Tax=Bacillus oleivorans TaxID=1448271 RepID=A0A285D3Q2_9BACI|nr:nitrite reductase [Bacillus oleivorans]SNX74461.1 nitrite/sulfite reductase ferredoxin-like protein [Bacillus oleivorans]